MKHPTLARPDLCPQSGVCDAQNGAQPLLSPKPSLPDAIKFPINQCKGHSYHVSPAVALVAGIAPG